MKSWRISITAAADLLPLPEVGVNPRFPVCAQGPCGADIADCLADDVVIELCSGSVGVISDGPVGSNAELLCGLDRVDVRTEK